MQSQYEHASILLTFLGINLMTTIASPDESLNTDGKIGDH